ncbi:replication-associated recombination protein A [Clostridium sp. 'deep sea']|uniref:replication-associated recombination protein A n=1 Tax=Clostridium sp. 'deep sea' TaxID=2779445 RepID=UPI001896A266|nr:replication-associated recombination protein A [Clostridium sp. 'deep sea']QOR35694.1 replication-associated recombination protein A [Clostridium sp. 'deep sea']
MNIFDRNIIEQLKSNAPLASRMRPKSLNEFVGQNHIIGEGCLLNRAIKADRLTSMIFYGPPGTGKTTLARIIANTTERNFEQINAVMDGVKDIRRIIANAKELLALSARRTILFIDEIHRFNRSQQDALLPSVEKGIITLIGATTENPFFEVNAPLLSRSRIFKLETLSNEAISQIITNALTDKINGLGNLKIKITEEAFNHIIRVCNGDARTALNAVELAVLTTQEDEQGVINITLDIAVESIQQKAIYYDKNHDAHYDTVSAFIKSMRGSDPDAALYYLARMIEAGEDIRFIARRIIICASEDVGNADPMALIIANNAAQACNFVGFPEGRIILAQAVSYIACAPKSNSSYKAIKDAQQAVREKEFSGIPNSLKDASYKSAAKLGHGKGYIYPHNYKDNFVVQQYLPDSVKNDRYYYPSSNGHERKMLERLIKLWTRTNQGEQK